MDGFELMPGAKLKVNILNDGPRQESKQKNQEEDLGEDTTNTYIHSAQDRTALMQKLSRNQDPMLLGNTSGAAANGQTQANQTADSRATNAAQALSLRPSNCVLFMGMFDATQVDLKKDPSFFMDIKD